MNKLTPEQQALVEANLGIAYGLARDYYKLWLNFLEFEDLEGFCLEGLSRAALTYDPNKGAKFSTYATTVIFRWVSHRTNTQRYRMNHGIKPHVYLEDLTKNMEEVIDWRDFLADTKTPHIEDDYISLMKVQSFWENIESILQRFNSPKRRFAVLYRMANPEASLKEIAEAAGLTVRSLSMAFSDFKIRTKEFLETA